MRATKCIVQPYSGGGLDSILDECLTLTYNAVEFGERNGITNRKGMKGFYQTLRREKIPSCYKVAVITRGCSVLESRRKGERRGFLTRSRRPLRPMVCLISGFFVTAKGRLFVPLRRDRYFDVQLNRHVVETLEGKELRSLTITRESLSFCYSGEVEELPVKTIYGVDRNEKNITFGNGDGVVQVDMTRAVKIRETTRQVLGSFKRNDVRVSGRLAHKYWRRCTDRTNQLLHSATNFIVETATRNHATFALEDLTEIRKMYRRGNGQGKNYRFRLNSWPHWKAKQMLEYKATWRGIKVIQLTKSETYGSSSMCSACGEKLHNPVRGDVAHRKQLWCQRCKAWTDRDVNAALNLSARGLARLASSRPEREKGLAVEARRGNPTRTAILRVDASKMPARVALIRLPKTHQNPRFGAS